MRQKIYEYIKSIFEENLKIARSRRKRCITIANYAIVDTYRKFYGKALYPGGRVGPMDIKYFESQGIVEKVMTYYPVDANGKITYGINAPVKFMDNIQAELRCQLVSSRRSEFYYASLMDGYHVMILISEGDNEVENDEFLRMDNNEIVDTSPGMLFNDYLARFYQVNWEAYRQAHDGKKSKTPLVIARLHFPE